MSTEFVKQTIRENLARVVIPHVADGVWSIYENAKVACERNKQPEKTLQTFQNLLTRIPQWTDDILKKEVERITLASKCDYIDDLLLGVFVSYIRAFASLQQVDTTNVNIEFERPSVALFLHTLYKASARKSWTNAYLFKTIGVSSEVQAKNRRDIETMLEGVLNEVIDSFIPWKEVSKAYFQARNAPVSRPPVSFGENEVKEIEEEEDDEEEYESETEGRPKLQLGGDVSLTLEDDEDANSVDTEAELEAKLKSAEGGNVSLNL